MGLISKFINTSLITNTKLQLSHQPNFQLYNNKVLATTRIGHSEFTSGSQHATTMTGKNTGKRKSFENTSAEHSTFRQSILALNPPSIYFEKPTKSTEKSDDEGNYKKIEVPIEAGNANSKNIEKRIRLFGDYDTSPEAWVKWRIELEEVIRDYPLESGEQKTSMALALLKGSARDKFQQTWRRLDTENAASPARQRKTPNEIFQLVMAEVGKSYFPILHAYQKQVVYMQHYLTLGNHTVRNFATRLRELNNYLPYFPREEGKAEPSALSDDDLIQILNQAKPEEWQAVILGANIELYKFDFQGTVDYFEKLEVRQALEAKRHKVEKTENPDTTKQGNRNNSVEKTDMSKTQYTKNRKCENCGRTNHTTKDCWFSPENKGKQKNSHKKNGSNDRNVLMTQEQFNAILKCLPRNSKSGKRKVRDFTPESSDAESVEMFGPKTTLTNVHNKEDSDESSI